jgi:hypothetical protein
VTRNIAATVAEAVVWALSLTALSAPAAAQAVTFEDLVGQAVVVDLHREQVIRREGRTFPIRIHQHWTYYVNDDHYIVMTLNTTVHGPQGPRKAKPSSGSFALDEVLPIKTRGGGNGVWKFADGTLTFIRTFPAGAFRAQFAFARSSTGLTCTVTETLARESGKEIKMESPFGNEITIVSSKALPSTCKVVKKQ